MYLSLGEILEYDQSPGSPLSSTFTDGEDILKYRLLPFCGRIVDGFQGYKLVAYCERDESRDKSPYEVRGVVNLEGKILRMSCNCEKEWTGQCKHVFATLLYCNRHSLEELHRVTTQEVEAMQNADFAPKPLLEYDCFKKNLKPKKHPRLTSKQEKSIKQILYGRDFETIMVKEEQE